MFGLPCERPPFRHLRFSFWAVTSNERWGHSDVPYAFPMSCSVFFRYIPILYDRLLVFESFPISFTQVYQHILYH
jgi:hypothetical protein